MEEGLRLLAISLSFLAVFAALGAGPALFLGTGLRARAALAPLLGLAIAMILLTNASALAPSGTSAWALLVPAAIASSAWALWQLRRGARPDPGEAAAPALLGAAGLLLAALPGLLHGTVGPIGLYLDDAWSYVPADAWLAGREASAPLTAHVLRNDLSLADGWILTDCGCRVGVTALGGGWATVLGTSPDQVHLPQLAAFLALFPAAVWVCARNVGIGRGGAAAGAAIGLSPALLMLVGDSVLANMAGLLVATLVVTAGLRAALDPDPRLLALTAVAFGGLLGAYPELAVPLLAVAGAGALALLVRSGFSRPALWRALRVPVVAAVGGVALAPVAVALPVGYFSDFLTRFELDVPRHLEPLNVGSWAFGIQHLYELARFDQLGPVKSAFALLLPLALAAVVAFGALRRRGVVAFAAVVPVAVAAALGLFAYFRYHECQYCLWRSLTFALPFLGVGLAAGFEALARERRGRAVAAVLVAVWLAAMARADVELERAMHRSVAITQAEARGLTDALRRLPPAPRVLLEGQDSTAAGTWGVEEAYWLARSATGTHIFLDGRPRTLLPSHPPARFYSPGYRHVVSVYPGLRSRRRLLSRHGRYALMRRAPIDVMVTGAGYARDEGEDEAIPWVQGPFDLWVASPRAGTFAIELGLRGPRAGANRDLACLTRRLRPGRTAIRLRPDLGGARTFPPMAVRRIAIATQMDLRLRPTESDPVPPPPKLLGIASIRVRPGSCG